MAYFTDEKKNAEMLAFFEAQAKAEREWEEANPLYRIEAFNSAKQMQDWLNANAQLYTLVSIADTNAYITAAVRRHMEFVPPQR